MIDEAFDLAPGEVWADRFDPADEAAGPLSIVTAAELATWEAAPWF